MKWTPEETETLVELRQRKLKIPEIARILGRKPAAVYDKIRLHELFYGKCGGEHKNPWMNEEHIRREYRLAKDQEKQIGILAELNDVPANKIKEIITK